MTSTLLYFAYGSNLSFARLSKRVSSAVLVTTGKLHRHRLVFHKVGRDGSAKCDVFFTGNNEDITYGAVYRIHPGHKQTLDSAEGLGNGYEIKNVTLITDQGEITAFTYYATHIDKSIKPFHWYKHHVLMGAEEHFFPEYYLSEIEQIDAVEDHDTDRMERELAIHNKPAYFQK